MGTIETKIPQLDNLLSGGLTEGSVSCVWVEPGIDGTPFVYQLAEFISRKRKVFYFVNSKSPRQVKEEMVSYGFSPNKINFVDAYSALVGAKTSSSLLVANPKDPAQFVNEISIIMKKIKNPLVIIDSFSNLFDLSDGKAVNFLSELKKINATVLCLFTEWGYDASVLKKLSSGMVDIIKLKSVREKLFTREYFGVTKLSGKNISAKVIPFRIEKPGGVKIYIPKVLVTGPFNAGKTSFIHSSSSKAVSVDRLGTTIALDHGHLEYNDFAVDLFGTPGQQRFDPILKLLGGDALGVIVVVSATDPQGYPRAIDMMKKAKVYGLPVVVAANKSNLRGALSSAQIKKRLGLKNIEVVPVVAKDLTKVQPGLPCQLKREDLDRVLDVLFAKMMEK